MGYHKSRSHRISLNFKEREFCGKVQEGNAPFVLNEVGMVFLYSPPSPFITSILDLSLFLGKIDYFFNYMTQMISQSFHT